MQHLFNCWPQVRNAVSSAKHIALFLDFDGTLAPFRRRPSQVKPLGPTLQTVLERLSGCDRLYGYIVSGRPLHQLREVVPLRNFKLLGLHGWEGLRRPSLVKELRLLRKAKRLLAEGLSPESRIWVEDKHLALAVHYREASARDIRQGWEVVEDILRTVEPSIHLLQGEKVWELLPRRIDGKGPAVSAVLAGLPRSTLPIFVGDSMTDESAFRIMPRGLTIHVGEKLPTQARFYLRNPGEVRTFLWKLDGVLRLAQ